MRSITRITRTLLLRVVLPYRRLLIIAAHALVLAAAYALAFALRFDLPLPPEYAAKLRQSLLLAVAIKLIVFWPFSLFQGLWRYVSLKDVAAIIKATTIAVLLFLGVEFMLGENLPRSIVALDWLLTIGLVAGARLTIRYVRELRERVPRGDASRKRAVVVGAGISGERLIRDINHSPSLAYDLVGVVDDSPSVQKRSIHGVPVLGTISELPDICRHHDVDELLVAIPSASQEERQRIIERCRTAQVPVKSVPSYRALIEGRARVGELQEVVPGDLLDRSAVIVDRNALALKLRDTQVLVTGAAGSIGSELCRQLAAVGPRTVVMLDNTESNLYFTHLELSDVFPEVEFVPVICDVLDGTKLGRLMRMYPPDIVYHAAAYKHVPLMEKYPIEAARTNVFGTETVARAAMEAGVGRFVLVSTDKAVRPVSIMGMTKRVAEDILRSHKESATTFSSVRFGNVLGSAGSVLPLFQWQMARGRPVTVTDPEATRYFMLIAEAAQLVLQAGLIGKGGEVFFLDMGEPVRIIDFAEDLIRLSGFRPGDDVQLETVGMRPGERLNEELVRETETMFDSGHDKILVAASPSLDTSAFSCDLESLRESVAAQDGQAVVDQLRSMAVRYSAVDPVESS